MTETEARLDAQLLALLHTRPTVMFSALADAFPEQKWRVLLSAVTRLRDRRLVEMVPYQWDYQVVCRHPRGSHEAGWVSAES